MPNWIDAHCHLFQAASPRESVARAEAGGVTGWWQGGVDPSDWEIQDGLARGFPGAFVPAFGLHPWWVADQDEASVLGALDRWEEAVLRAPLAGEMGLDALRKNPELQRTAFEGQLFVAKALGKPLVLHIVRAHDAALALLESAAPLPGGLVHSFSGGKAEAKRYVELGLILSIGPAATRAGHRSMKEAIPSIPADHLVIESDSAEPLGLLEVARSVAAIRGEAPEALLDRSAGILGELLSCKR